MPTPTPPPTAVSVRDAMTARGYDAAQFDTDDALNTYLLDTLERQHADKEYTALGRQVAPNIDDFTAFQEQRQQQPTPKEPDPEPEPAGLVWDVPEDIDPRYESLLVLDQTTGLYRAPDDFPALASQAEKKNQFATWQKKAAHRVLTDLPSLLEQASQPLLKPLQDKIAELERGQAEYQQQQELSALTSQYEKDWYAHDENGQPTVDPRTNQYVTTPFYEATAFYVEQMRQAAPNLDNTQLLQLGLEKARLAEQAGMLTPNPPASPTPTLAPAQPSPAAVGQEKRETFLEQARADHQATRGGFEPDPSAPAGPDGRPPTMEELTLPELKKLGPDA